MSDEKKCWCLYCIAGYPVVCVAEIEKENKELRREVESLKKANGELAAAGLAKDGSGIEGCLCKGHPSCCGRPEFKVGDKVKFKIPKFGCTGVGMVCDVYGSNCEVLFDGLRIHGTPIRGLEIVKEIDIKVGDKVKVEFEGKIAQLDMRSIYENGNKNSFHFKIEFANGEDGIMQNIWIGKEHVKKIEE